jgi:5-methyltetrahydrofolate--homocysteine methyltransferase
MSEILTELSTAIIEGNLKDIVEMTQDALADGLDAKQILDQGLMPGMDHVGAEFKAGNMFVPEVLRSARAMQASMALLKPKLAETGAKLTGKVLLGTVKGDLHDIGKNLIASMLEGGGFEVIDLGTDVSPEKFVQAVQERKPNLVCLSALLTVTMPSMKTTIDALKSAGVREQVHVVVGGAPVTEQWAREIGADAYGANAASAVPLARRLVGK